MTETSNKAIVCVDDEAIILMSLKAQLRNSYKDKFIIETSLSGEDAILIIEELMRDGVKSEGLRSLARRRGRPRPVPSGCHEGRHGADSPVSWGGCHAAALRRPGASRGR